MIDMAEIEQYFPNRNIPIKEEDYTFTISLSQDEKEETFVVNLKIKQDDTKDTHLIKFRMGVGRHEDFKAKAHETQRPHFEVDIYERKKDSFSATVYFTFEDTQEKLMDYLRGTVVIIAKIIEGFIKNHSLDISLINKLVFKEDILKELGKYEPILINALFECYEKSNLVVRQGGELIVIKTPHNFNKYLNVDDLKPLYLPLMDKIIKIRCNRLTTT